MKVDIAKIKKICEEHICPDCPFAKEGTMSCIMIDVPSAWDIEKIEKVYGKELKTMRLEESDGGRDNEDH